MKAERTVTFSINQVPWVGAAVDLAFGNYWTVLRYEDDPDAVWEVYDFDTMEAGPKTLRVVLRRATASEVEQQQDRARQGEERIAQIQQPWWRKVFA